MTPVEQAAAVYDREPCVNTFREDLEAHLLNGLVFSTPTAFVMARYTSRESLTCALETCIHVHLAAGDVMEIFNFPHIPCEWVSFERDNVLRFHRYEHLKKRCFKILQTPRFSRPT